jgi:hypothetical protein
MTSCRPLLAGAADLLAERGWVPERTYRSTDRRMTALQAITAAVDELAGTGPETAGLYEAAIDAVCLHVSGRRSGAAPGVSCRWHVGTRAAHVPSRLPPGSAERRPPAWGIHPEGRALRGRYRFWLLLMRTGWLQPAGPPLRS